MKEFSVGVCELHNVVKGRKESQGINEHLKEIEVFALKKCRFRRK